MQDGESDGKDEEKTSHELSYHSHTPLTFLTSWRAHLNYTLLLMQRKGKSVNSQVFQLFVEMHQRGNLNRELAAVAEIQHRAHCCWSSFLQFYSKGSVAALKKR